MINILVILFQCYFSIPISQSNPFWIFNVWFYSLGFISQLIILYAIFTQPGVFTFIENEVRNIYYKNLASKEERFSYYATIVLEFIELFLFLYFGLYNVFIAYSLYLGTFYLIRHFLFSTEKS